MEPKNTLIKIILDRVYLSAYLLFANTVLMNFYINRQFSFDEIVSVRYNCFPTIVYLYQHRFCAQIFIVLLLFTAPTNYLNDPILIILNLFSLYPSIHWFIYFFSYPPFSLLLNYLVSSKNNSIKFNNFYLICISINDFVIMFRLFQG